MSASPYDSWLRGYLRIDQILVEHGFPRTSPWWWKNIVRWRKTGRKRWVLRVGRRGGKSSTLCRVVVNEALNGTWQASPGDPPVVAIVSVDKAEAGKRLLMIKAILEALGANFEATATEIRLLDRPCIFQVRTCTIEGVIGFTALAILADEMARWETADSSANPAKEVLGALRPTMATIDTAFELDCSSPWGTDDYHAKMFDDGDNLHQCVSYAPTWEANPTISEEKTHDLEPDPKLWERNYKAIPSETVERQWFGDLDSIFLPGRAVRRPGVRYWAAIDPAFSHDKFGWAVVSSIASAPEGAFDIRQRQTVIEASGAWDARGQKPKALLERLRNEVLIPWGVAASEMAPVYTDQYESHSLSEIARGQGMYLHEIPWLGGDSPGSKLSRYRACRVEALQGQLHAYAETNEGLREQMKRVQSRIMPSGGERIELMHATSHTLGHADQLSAAMLCASQAIKVPAQILRTVEEVERSVDQREDEWMRRKRELAQRSGAISWRPD